MQVELTRSRQAALRDPAGIRRRRADERAARRSLRAQIERLEEELAGLLCSSWPRELPLEHAPAGGPPRLLGLADLERLRDELAGRAREARRRLEARGLEEERNRRLIEEMLTEPERHRWIRVGNEDIGEPGCRHWHVRPRWGLLGMLMSWWRVVVSSGCP